MFLQATQFKMSASEISLYSFVVYFVILSSAKRGVCVEYISDDVISYGSSASDSRTIDVLVFISSSGQTELTGRAHTLGIKLAVDDYVEEAGGVAWKHRLIYHDSQVSTVIL